jgi:hypothetical protein
VTVGGVLSEALNLYQRFFKRFFITAAAVFVVVDLLTAIAADAQGGGVDGVSLFWTLVSIAVTLVGSLWVQGALIRTVADVRDGRADEDVEAVYRSVRPFLLPLFVAGLLAGIGVAVGLLLLVAPGLFLLARWSVVTPAIVLEGRSALEALGRSWELVRGKTWTALGVVIVTLILAAVANGVIVGVLFFLPDFIQNWLGGLIANSLTTPFVALSWTVMYFHLRGEGPPAPAEEAPAA